MAKYLVETYYTCTFKVNHYLDEINETELKNLEKRDDGKFEVLDVKLDNRKTKTLDPNNKKYDESTKFRLTYELLNGTRNLRYFKPCFKHYLLSQVKSRFAEVPAPEWEIATFLPTAQWEKASAGRVYQDSRKASNG